MSEYPAELRSPAATRVSKSIPAKLAEPLSQIYPPDRMRRMTVDEDSGKSMRP